MPLASAQSGRPERSPVVRAVELLVFLCKPWPTAVPTALPGWLRSH
jgi:hypothetical protein